MNMFGAITAGPQKKGHIEDKMGAMCHVPAFGARVEGVAAPA